MSYCFKLYLSKSFISNDFAYSIQTQYDVFLYDNLDHKKFVIRTARSNEGVLHLFLLSVFDVTYRRFRIKSHYLGMQLKEVLFWKPVKKAVISDAAENLLFPIFFSYLEKCHTI